MSEKFKKNGKRARPETPVYPATAWQPPDVDDQLQISLGGSFVDEFVLGHKPTDVLRELVQNEYDAGGQSISIEFGETAMAIVGTGKPIGREGWKRLSVIVGTGRTIGDNAGSTIKAKANGIGSKNFGLRSLFLVGDRIFVRSAGYVAVLDLPKLGTTRVRDPERAGQTGVSIHIDYRTKPFSKLAAFTEHDEARALDSMTTGILPTLTKLAMPGGQKGLRNLRMASQRLGRTIEWQQRVVEVPCRMSGVKALRRQGTMTVTKQGARSQRAKFEELEFERTIAINRELSFDNIPGYFAKGRDKLRIGVSLSLEKGKPNLRESGHFYYPLQAPRGGTGTSINVSAPFELNGDRSALLDSNWNSWLCEQAADLVIDLLSGDWFERFGSAAFSSLLSREPADPTFFVTALKERLSKAACWPTMSTQPGEKFAATGSLVVPAHPSLFGHIGVSKYLHSSLVEDKALADAVIEAGARVFSANSLVRLRCAPIDKSRLQTKIAAWEADYHYADYESVLAEVDRQVSIAISLSQLGKLSNENWRDLKNSASTLSKDRTLVAASELFRVDPSVVACPLPSSAQLHPELFAYRAISSHCLPFDEEKWVREVSERAISGTTTEAELLAVERRILQKGAEYGRLTVAAIRRSPVLRDNKENWVAAEDMVILAGRSKGTLQMTLRSPSRTLAKETLLVGKLRIRSTLEPNDLVIAANWVVDNPGLADKFEEDLARYGMLLTRQVVKKLADIPFLRCADDGLGSPENLHLDNVVIRLCVPPERIVGGSRTELYRRLQIREAPDNDALIEMLEALAGKNISPSRPDVFYDILARAARDDDGFLAELKARPVLWVDSEYHYPDDVLVGAATPRIFDEAVPVVRRPDIIARSYADIGAAMEPTESHWQRFFETVGARLTTGETASRSDRRSLQESYHHRSSAGLPDELDEEICCLIDRSGRAFNIADARIGVLVENDFTALADAIDREILPIGIVEPTERTRSFFRAIGLQRLTDVCGSGRVTFGDTANATRWFDDAIRAEQLVRIQSPLFMTAVYKLATAFQRGFSNMSEARFSDALMAVEQIEVFETIGRQFQLHGYSVSVDAEVGVVGSVLGIVRPKTKLDIHHLLAQALAELAGFSQVGEARLFAASIMSLFHCHSDREIGIFLERQGIVTTQFADEDSDEDKDVIEAHELNDLVEEAFADMRSAVTSGSTNLISNEPPASTPSSFTPPPPTKVKPFVLPPIDDVTPNVAEVSGATIAAASNSRVGSGGSWDYSAWRAPTAADTERDNKVGTRGEELVYRLELDRVRVLGHENPEDHVIWVSRNEPGADHDIRSVDTKGRIIYIEVKSTTGVDGRFVWSKREFELATSMGKRYELCRVYEAASLAPRIKRFADPVRLLASRQLTLDLGDLRANIEGSG